MWPYFLIYTSIAFFAVSEDSWNKSYKIPPIPIILILSLFIGGRFEVGADWFNYLGMFQGLEFADLYETLIDGDPAYQLLQWVVARLDLGIVAVNLAVAIIFSIGLVKVCNSLPRPWLALTVSVPYMLIVVAMGYTRQSAALGLVMVALTYLCRQKVKLFLLFVVLAATFHKSALVMICIGELSVSRRSYVRMIFQVLLVLASYFLLVAKEADELVRSYIEQEMQSSGALIRLSMNLLPATILFLFKARLKEMMKISYIIWFYLSIISIIAFMSFFMTASSAALDRLALYLLPLQPAVLSYIPGLIKTSKFGERIIVLHILFFYLSVLTVWLLFAVNSRAWIPYRFNL